MTMELVVVFLSVAVFSTCWASNSPEISLTRTQLLELMKRVDEIEVMEKRDQLTLRRQDSLIQQLVRQAMVKDTAMKAMQEKLENVESLVKQYGNRQTVQQSTINNAEMSVPVPSYDEVKSSSQNNTKDEIMDESMGHQEEDPNKGQKSSSVDHVSKRLLLTGSASKPSTVAFHAVNTQSDVNNIGPQQTILFNSVLLNNGNGFHANHGAFFAPKAGLYLFSVSLLSSHQPNRYVEANIVKDNSPLAMIYALGTNDGSDRDQGSVTVTVELAEGDEVWVRHENPAIGSMGGYSGSSFTGVMLATYA